MKDFGDPLRRHVQAAMRLLGDPRSRPDGGAFRIVGGPALRDRAQTAGMLSMTLGTSGGLLYLEMPDDGVWRGPRRLIVFRRSDDPERGFDLDEDCAFWAADEESPLLVASRDGARHFELGRAGLVAREGPPAGELGAGFELATQRLRAVVGAPTPDDQPRLLSDMIHDDDLDPQFRLEALASSDPKARASMMRHSVALRSMLTGRLHERDVAGLLIGADLRTSFEGVERFKELCQIDGNDRIMVGFDADDPLGPPVSFGLWHVRAGVATFYDRCAPWMPPKGSRAWLIGQNDREIMTFRFERSGFLRTPGRPAADPWPGIGSARERLARFVRTT